MSKPAKSAESSLFDLGVEKSAPTVDEPARRIPYHALPDDPAPFDALLARYAAGRDVSSEVAVAIWQWTNTPMGQQIKAALEAAERHGAWEKENF